jgi:hypothetical protein
VEKATGTAKLVSRCPSEPFREPQDVLSALAEGRNSHPCAGDPVIEVAAEAPRLHLASKTAIRSCSPSSPSSGGASRTGRAGCTKFYREKAAATATDVGDREMPAIWDCRQGKARA